MFHLKYEECDLGLDLAQERRKGESLSHEAGDHSWNHPGADHRGGDGTRAEDDAVTL